MITIDLKGKLAVVTGGSGELGRVICRMLAKAGADVAVHYYHGAQRAEKLVQQLREYGVRAEAFCADVTNQESVYAMRDEIEKKMGTPLIVVDAAYVAYQTKPLLEQPVKDYYSEFESCVLHNVHMAKAFVPAMQEQHFGRFIGINTEQSMECNPNFTAYTSGKRGMDGLLRVLAKEVATDGITVNEVAPGWVITDKSRETPEDDEDYIRRIPMHRRVEDRHIADAVLFLASDLARLITGVYLPVTGANIMPGI